MSHPPLPRSILFVVPYPERKAPSQRFRVEQYVTLLSEMGYRYEVHPFFKPNEAATFYSPGSPIRKILIALIAWWRRMFLLLKVGQFGFIFVHREAAPFGPPLFEWIAVKILRRKIIFDLDDAIWLTDKVGENMIERMLRWRSKVAAICRWSHKVSCGNHYIARYASQFNKNIVYNPTVLDTTAHYNRELYPHAEVSNHITIGWTGSHSTLKYFYLLEEHLLALERRHSHVRFIVIADRAPETKLKNIQFVRWTPENEVQSLLGVDIGIMPLPDDEWSKGKCGFKALQYMSLEIPAVVSAVGTNTDIIQHNVNGLLVTEDKEWQKMIEKLINDPALRAKLGNAGRQTVIQRYSLNSTSSTFLSLFT